MGKKQKFTEDLLLEAVVKYAEVCSGKIKATELAEWSRINIKGLEDVRDYHFTRPVRERDPKTGKMKERIKLCTERLNEINRARSISVSVKTNILLKSSNIDAMFELPISAQRNLIIETRNTVNKLIHQTETLRRENNTLKDANKDNIDRLHKIQEIIDGIQKNQTLLEKKVSYLMKATDEVFRKEKLLEMGIDDGYIDMDVFIESIGNSISELTDFNQAIVSYVDGSYPCLSDIEKETEAAEIKSNIIEGLFK